MSIFEQDTALTRVAAGHFKAQLPERWNIIRGPNGGFLAAVVMRAMQATVNDADRPPRSFTLHYLAVPRNEAMDIVVTVERAGRSMTTVSARFSQGGRTIGIGTAAFARAREGVIDFNDLPLPDVPGPEETRAFYPFGKSSGTSYHAQFELRRVFGGELLSGSDVALTGGWVRLADLHKPDAASIALFSDCWPPAFFVRASMPVPAPTIDLTVHFRTDIDSLQLTPESWVLVRFETRYAHEGYIEEDGILWAEDGTLLAHSRQLGLCEPYRQNKD